MSKENLKVSEPMAENPLLNAVPDLTRVWYQVLEKYHGKDAYEKDRLIDALWLLEKAGFIQLKFGL